jgi:tetratricopeptide (TPR) repeat protein
MLVLSENRFNTITPFNWWAIEEKYDTPDEMKSGKLGEILGFAERKTCHAIFLVDVGKWHEAEQLCRDVITRMEKDKVWKDMDCPYALNGTKNLALVYKHQEKLGESAILFKQLLSRCLEQYGKDHHWTLNSAHHLGVLHKNLGQLEEAANIQSLVMTSRKASHGEFDLLMLTSMHQLALVYRAQDRDNEAEDLHKEVINSLSAAYGECHSLVIAATKGLAMILRKQGRDLEAELVETSARRLSRSTAVT